MWWELRDGEYAERIPDPNGLLKSGIFPGLWLDTRAVLNGDLKTLVATLRRGLESPEHAAVIKPA